MLNWKRKRVWIPALLLLALVIGAAINLVSAGGIEREKQRVRAAGLPTTPEEWDRWYPSVPPERNAAPLVLEAAGFHVTSAGTNDPNQTALPPPGTPFTSEHLEIIARYLEDNRETLAKLHAALKLPDSRYPVKLWQTPNFSIDHLAPLKSLSLLLRWEAIYHSALGRREEALRSIHAAFALSRTLRDEPVLISQLVHIATVAINLLALERVVSEHPLAPEELWSLIALLETAEKDGQRGMHRALIGERGGYGMRFMAVTFDDFLSLSGGGASLSAGRQVFGGAMFALYKASGLQQQDARIYFETMNGFITATTNDFPEMMRLSRQTETNYHASTTRGFGKMAVFSRMILPALLKAVSKEAVIAGSLRSARAALIIESARMQQGAIPEDISSLQMPPDPFTSEPLIFEKLETGYMVYSPGASASAGTQRRPKIGFTVAR